MKRIIPLLLALVLLLCGCGTAETKALAEIGEGTTTKSLAIVTVTINPEFELYLDANFCVTKVRCLNEDAVTTLESVQADLIGNNYGNVMMAILDGADKAGFLAPDATITVKTALHVDSNEEGLQSIAQSLTNSLEMYNEKNGLALKIEVATPKVDEKAAEAFMKYFESQAGNPSNGGGQSTANDGTSTGPITDENGNEIGTATYYYNEDGLLIKDECTFNDGRPSSITTYEYDASGNMIKEDYINSDGSSGTFTYSPSGTIESFTYSNSDGSNGTYTYFANGFIESYTYNTTDGYTCTETYYENGVLKSSITDDDGNHYEYYYDENGTLVNEVIDERPWNVGEPNGVVEQEVFRGDIQGVSTMYFDENGLLYKMVDVYPDGATYETLYYENGNIKSIKSDDQYGSSYTCYAEDGTEMRNIGEPNGITVQNLDDGGTTTRYFDENGYLCKEVTEHPGQNPREATYYPNGNRKTESLDYIDPTNGKEKHAEYHYYENGTLQADSITDIHGNSDESTYYPNGNRETHLIKFFYGAYWDRVYYENGTLKSEISYDPNGDPSAWQYTERYYNENGQMQKFIGKQPNGDYQEQHFHSNGQLAVNIMTDAQGYYHESRYDENGNMTYDNNSGT